jgi:glycosyltransferase involved in cell wall biosynthesis
MQKANISICIATHKRPLLLSELLDSIAGQDIGSQEFCLEIVVVDNDRNGSAGEVVKDFAQWHPQLLVTYEIEPKQNIALARNKSVSMASGEYIAFIDDDEHACPEWLARLYTCMQEHGADAVFGPVLPVLPDDCPGWIKKGNFFSRKILPDGHPVNRGRTGNALVRATWLRAMALPFNPRFGLSGGSDFDFFYRILNNGAKLCASEFAVVYEKVEPGRLRLSWLLGRALRGGQVYAERTIKGKGLFGKVCHSCYRLGLCCFSLALTLVSLPLGRHRSVWWLTKFCSNLGQMSVFLPYRYEEYKRANRNGV